MSHVSVAAPSLVCLPAACLSDLFFFERWYLIFSPNLRGFHRKLNSFIMTIIAGKSGHASVLPSYFLVLLCSCLTWGWGGLLRHVPCLFLVSPQCLEGACCELCSRRERRRPACRQGRVPPFRGPPLPCAAFPAAGDRASAVRVAESMSLQGLSPAVCWMAVFSLCPHVVVPRAVLSVS